VHNESDGTVTMHNRPGIWCRRAGDINGYPSEVEFGAPGVDFFKLLKLFKILLLAQHTQRGSKSASSFCYAFQSLDTEN
jgi:hypothetical protein